MQSVTRNIFQHDDDVGQIYIPGLKARIAHEAGGYLVRTNPQGFRSDRDFAAPKTKAKRILLFGDSYSAGDGVSNAHRYADIIDKGSDTAEILNFAVSSTGTDQQFLTYRKFARGIEADAVVIAVLVENVRRNLARYRKFVDGSGETFWRAKPYFELRDGELVRGHDPVPGDLLTDEDIERLAPAAVDRGGRFSGLRRLAGRLGLRERLLKTTGYQPVPHYNSRKNPGWLLTSAILRQWRSEIDVPVILMPLPLYHHIEGMASADAYRARFAELAAAEDFILHDPFDDLAGRDMAERRGFRFETDVHPTRAGHAAIAASLDRTISGL